jgi:hypothetical protein
MKILDLHAFHGKMWSKMRPRLISIVAILIFFLTVVSLSHLSSFHRIRNVMKPLETNRSPPYPSRTPDPEIVEVGPIPQDACTHGDILCHDRTPPNNLPELSDNVFNKQSTIALPLSQWLQIRGLLPGKTTLIVTIADSSYLRSLRSFQRRLSTWNYDKQMLVLCLDQTCADDPELYNTYPGYIQDDENVMHAVGAVKVRKRLS